MRILRKVVFGALTGFGAILVAHAYGPSNPATVRSVPPGFAECAVDGGVCKVPAGATAYVVYGTNGKFATAQGTGDFTCLPAGWVKTPTAAKPQDLGIPDPFPNVQKKCYLQGPVAAPTTRPGPTPVANPAAPTIQAAPTPVTPPPAPTTQPAPTPVPPPPAPTNRPAPNPASPAAAPSIQPAPTPAAKPGAYVPKTTDATVLSECAKVIKEFSDPNIHGTLADSQARMQRVTNYCKGNISAECDTRIGYANTPNTGINPITLKNVVANCKQ